ncbi:MAG: sigma factor-like helix-turn-helix DNA-binding protein [bacterium]|nr:sigma factor-like helix-turn-helix DNA-binding protein [bacterium]
MNSGFIKKLVKELISDLSPRQREVIEGRYGLKGGEELTLAAVGDRYGLTRERIRQIERAALNSIESKFANGSGVKFVSAVNDIFKKFRGVREEALLVGDLRCASADLNNIRFALEASSKFNHQPEDDDFYSFWYVDNIAKKQANDFISKLKAQLKNVRAANNDYKPGDEWESNCVAVSKHFATSPFGQFGLREWPEIVPQNSREWAYLILKKNKQPMHFTELAKVIDDYRQTHRKTNAQTVHNELIKDERFVLVGRGTYGLRELGLLPGTAKEVMAHFIKKNGPLHSRDLIKLVLKERMFKENTLLINLQNRESFQRLQDGRYDVREV